MSEAPPEAPVYVRRDGLRPVAELDRIRAEEPISRIEVTLGPVRLPAWLVARHEDVRTVFGDHTRFSSAMLGPPPGTADEPGGEPGGAPGGGPGGGGGAPAGLAAGLLHSDPPEHTRLRNILKAEFTMAQMRRLEPRVRAIIDEHLDAIEEHGPPADLMEEFARPVPLAVISEILGIPYADGAEFLRLSNPHLDFDKDEAERTAAVMQSHAMLRELVRERRRGQGGDGGLLARLVAEHGADFSDDELAGMAALIVLAGHENMANMLGLGTMLLLSHPDQAAIVRDKPEAAATAVEEILRYISVVPTSTPRTAVHDVTLSGRLVRAGELLVCSLVSANRDEALGDGLADFDVTRPPVPHLAFGHGIHHCLGAGLARMEMRLAYPALLRRFPDLRVAVREEDLVFREHSVSFGLRSLPVTW
ncbi:cytochrome P450 [Actinomadura keratinilytica]|uniref:Cytochrome P450 n=1 Tax=Actinomadura keratinilytica TaxID=547461 RepID=A0ABP7ZIP7_9ACTN